MKALLFAAISIFASVVGYASELEIDIEYCRVLLPSGYELSRSSDTNKLLISPGRSALELQLYDNREFPPIYGQFGGGGIEGLKSEWIEIAENYEVVDERSENGVFRIKIYAEINGDGTYVHAFGNSEFYLVSFDLPNDEFQEVENIIDNAYCMC